MKIVSRMQQNTIKLSSIVQCRRARERNVYTNLLSTVRPEPSGMDANQQQPHRRAKWIGRHFSRSTIEWFIHLSRAQRVVAHGQKKIETRLGWVTLLFFLLALADRVHAACNGLNIQSHILYCAANKLTSLLWAFLRESRARARVPMNSPCAIIHIISPTTAPMLERIRGLTM